MDRTGRLCCPVDSQRNQRCRDARVKMLYRSRDTLLSRWPDVLPLGDWHQAA